MSPRQALTSALHGFVVFAFFIGGLFFCCLPYLPSVRVQLVDLFSNRMQTCTQIGFWIFLASLVLCLGFYTLNRGRYLRIRMGAFADLHLVRQTIEDCLTRQFPKKISLSDVEMGRKAQLEIRVSLPSLNDEMRTQLFIEVEKALVSLLRERFGYAKPFYLVVKI